MVEAIQDNADWAAFLDVLLQQLGLPVPAVPTLMVAGSLANTPAKLMEADVAIPGMAVKSLAKVDSLTEESQ